ncbi:MAG: hypothetical protein RL701_7253 [Pseudomonadota bacterium]
MSKRATLFGGCLLLLLSGCLVTDEIEAPPESYAAPQITSRYADGNTILFDLSTNGTRPLQIPLNISYENAQRTLKIRWRVRTQLNTNGLPLEFQCPEEEIVPIARLGFPLNIATSRFAPSSCSLIDVAVSEEFLDCTVFKNVFDIPARGTPDDVGRATFQVWETSDDPVQKATAAVMITSTCPREQYVPPTTAPIQQTAPNNIPAMEQ